MRNSRIARLLALLFAFALVSAACGDDGDSSETATTEAASDDSVTADDDMADDDMSDGDMADDDMADDGSDMADDSSDMSDDDMADDDMSAMLADNAVFGNGAEEWEHAVHRGEASPLAAEGEAINLFLVNLEGSPGGSFPEVREGLEIGIEFINSTLGGVGADLANGVPGRPLALESCPHTLDPAEAQACAAESVAADPDIIVKGIDFFSPIFWPVWGGQYPVIDTLPIFVADFVADGSLAMSGACVTAFPGAAQAMVEAGHDRIAIIYSDNAPGQECWADTQERFYKYYEQTAGVEFRGFPEAPGDPSDNDANVQEVLNFLEGSNGAVHFGIQASDCAEYNDALDAAGNTHEVWPSGSCVDDAVTSAASATGKHFGFEGPPAPDNESLLAQFHPFWQWEVNQREAVLVAGEPESPLSTFMRLGFNTAVMAYQVVGDFVATGGDPSDHQALKAFMGSLDNQHRVAGTPLDCANKVSDWGAVCAFFFTSFTWNGDEFVANDFLGHDPADPSTWINVRDLLSAVASEVPRG